MRKRLMCILLAAAVLAAGCSTMRKEESVIKPQGSESESSDTEITEFTIGDLNITEPVPEIPEIADLSQVLFAFEPHIHTDLLSEIVTDEMWESLYNMVDAIRIGDDSFKCSDEFAYEWCTYEVTVGMIYPPACTLVTGAGYENGIAKLKYHMDKDEFHVRCKEFEEEIVKILNEATRPEYSDFEKLMGLYDYMCKYWVYDYDDTTEHTCDNFGSYACLMTRNGICSEIAYSLTYLLLQAGVEATPYGASCNHDWTYVVIGGNGYHVDATWALHGEMPEGQLLLENFMMTEEDRINDGLNPATFQVDFIWGWKADYDLKRFSATDATFEPIRYGMVYKGIDTERNVLIYETYRSEIRELSYGDM